MQIKKTNFITSMADVKNYAFDNTAEICFAGRSNAGKSTFINTLTGQKICKTSSSPGRTRLVNFFSVNDGQFNIVDLPGYGYAKACKEQAYGWQQLIESYFNVSQNLKRVFVLADCRVKSPLDQEMLKYLFYYKIPFTVLASKCDKLKKSEVPAAITALAAHLKIGRDNIVSIAHDGTGREAVLKVIEESILE